MSLPMSDMKSQQIKAETQKDSSLQSYNTAEWEMTKK